ncbi:MAG: lytic transglycosylase domain-containing protein [Aggregatilineales bacterium]
MKPRQAIAWLSQWLLLLQAIGIVASIGLGLGAFGAMTVVVTRNIVSPVYSPPVIATPGSHAVLPLPTSISPIFAPSVQHWGTQLVAWGKQSGIDPNLLATVMQIESCGDPQAGSSAGAQGLFQVMPFHFNANQDPYDPDTNAQAGIAYLKGALELAGGHVGLALAGYNGGYGVMSGGWGTWSDETRNYYVWGTGIYFEALTGHASSASLQDWLNAGGSALCQQATARLTGTLLGNANGP